ncbi:hypothetical protein D3C76_1249470 [compost metagenome]
MNQPKPMPATATTVDRSITVHSILSVPALPSVSQSPNQEFAPGTKTKPAATASTANTASGTVMAAEDSWAWAAPSLRLFPVKTRTNSLVI